MKVLFISLRAKEPLAYGVMSLAGSLRHHGHQVDLVHAMSADEVAATAQARDADLLAMSATTGLHRVYVTWARQLRRCFPDKGLVLGGPHATFFPEVIEQAPFDGLCIGEGEQTFPVFLDLYAAGFPELPPGFWIRRDGGRGPVEKGPPAEPLVELDRLPPPAFDLYYDQNPKYRALPIRVFMATRGCPFRCTYCFNRTLVDQRPSGAPVIRAHDPSRVVEEINRVRARWGGRMVWFLDANFASRTKWLLAFAQEYRRHVSQPFFCKLRPERATAQVVKTLADAGCTAVGLGIESGSESLRRQVLDRKVTDGAIIEGCRQLKARGIKIMSFNMLGLPGETLDDALRTVALNVACGVDYGAATILQPYPGTEIARQAVARGQFDGDFERLSYSYFDDSPLRFESPRQRRQVTNLQRLFTFAVEFPEVRRLLRWLIDRPTSRLFDHLFLTRHELALRHGFYRCFTRGAPVALAPDRMLSQACRELGLSQVEEPSPTSHCPPERHVCC
jgi:radical SAM superfamily enzyme YgiQ (UPF0313 family)